MAIAITGCAWNREMTSAPPTQFLQSTGTPMTNKVKRLPFDHAWHAPDAKFKNYTHLVLKPISMAYLRDDQWKESASSMITSREKYLEFATEVARNWSVSLVNAFRSADNRFILTSDKSQPGTLVLEVAMTEVVFGRPETYAASWAVTGGGIAESAFLAPTMAFELRVLDGATGRVVATAADRRSTRIKLVDFNRFTITKANQEICNEWSRQIMQAFNKEKFPVVKRQAFSAF